MAAIWDSQANGDHCRYFLCAEPPRPARMSGRTGRRQGAKGGLAGCQGCPPNGLGGGSASCARKLMLNSPVHAALPANLPQSFLEKSLGFLARGSC